MMIMDKGELNLRRKINRKRARNREILGNLTKFTMIIVMLALIWIASKNSYGDIPEEYTIPNGAISGGEYIGSDGATYERFQLGDKFFILSKSNGGIMPRR